MIRIHCAVLLAAMSSLWNHKSNKTLVFYTWIRRYLGKRFKISFSHVFLFRNVSLYFVTEENVTSLLIDDCNIDRSNTLSFRIILMQGVTFVLVSALISLYINKVDRKKLLSMITTSIVSFLFVSVFKPLFLLNFSRLAIGLLCVLRFNSTDTVFLCDGRVFHDIFKLRPVRWHH